MTTKAKIKIVKDGPYMVSGKPKITERFIAPNEEGASWTYQEGKDFATNDSVALCRCGKSKNKPFCDGAHTKGFVGTCTASTEPIVNAAKVYKGPNYTLLDNEAYCAFARFCDAFERVWNLVRQGTDRADKLAIRETLNCPAGRLMIQENKTGKMLEENAPPTISVLQDPALGVSGPLYLKGGFLVEDENGNTYEIRSRQTLCRCGLSSNKPFCDGTHASANFNDDVDSNISNADIEKALE